MQTRSRKQLASTETMTKFIHAYRTEPFQMPWATEQVLLSEHVLWSLQPIWLIKKQNNSSTILPHDANEAK